MAESAISSTVSFFPQLYRKIKDEWDNSTGWSEKYSACKELSRQLNKIVGLALKEKNYSDTKKELFKSVRRDLRKINKEMVNIHDKVRGRRSSCKFEFQLTNDLKKKCFDKLIELKTTVIEMVD